MNADLSRLLQEWPYEPGTLNVRLITGEDGEPRLQVRIALGVLQMFVDGRPDGERPFGYESLLEYHESRLDQLMAGGEEAEGEGDGPRFSLTPEECEEIRDEAAMYYHRYIALLALEDYERVIRDTTRNLRALDLCAQHGETEADRAALEQFRPYIMMVRARALASQALKDNEPKAALHAIDEGLDALKQYFSDAGEPDHYEQSAEVQMLRGMREALVPKLPVSQKTELRSRLARALEQENYELAAILRDELRMLKE
jgi:hypothetical protein